MKHWYVILILLLVLPCKALAQHAEDEGEWVEAKSIVRADSTESAPEDSLPVVQWQPDPMRAVWMGTIIPGYGQIYNRAYWKLPIVYGAFMGCAYAITWNNRMYQDYKQAYRDILTDTDGTKTSYLDLLPEGYTIEMMGGKENYTQVLKNGNDTYRRYRDISIVATVLVYALSIVDAYVDAQLYDFDISPDLSMNVAPQLYIDERNNRSAEVHFAIKF